MTYSIAYGGGLVCVAACVITSIETTDKTRSHIAQYFATKLHAWFPLYLVREDIRNELQIYIQMIHKFIRCSQNAGCKKRGFQGSLAWLQCQSLGGGPARLDTQRLMSHEQNLCMPVTRKEAAKTMAGKIKPIVLAYGSVCVELSFDSVYVDI